MPSVQEKALQAQAPLAGDIVLSIDAMGGDQGPAAVVAGIARSAERDSALRFIVHGDEAQILPLIEARGISGVCEVRHAADVVTMEDKPSAVLRTGKGTSMWSTIEAVRSKEAAVAVSCGNTGALMAVSMIRLRKLPGVNRPAIACLWPSHNPQGFNVMLDVGADIKAEPRDLLQYALMGMSYARNGLGLERPRVGLLNVGTEEHKGRAELKIANDLIAAAADEANFDYVGYVEGGDLPSARVDVIVTDGFTGNIALKTGEGTAKLAFELLKQNLMSSLISKIGALMARGALKKLAARIDPRRVNGGVFLGLNGTVVKSHGGADETGVAAAIGLASALARSGFQDRLAARVASSGGDAEGDVADVAADQDQNAAEGAIDAPKAAGGQL
ncbi:phosphate acyltransferase PlsX [Albirhodobacter sp. R86504]|uniref:phosphate acyltransferase PlsX n=1 Tax=Albirhodobacter sp. R86504 TaxID=3093848 RepID=UPI00367261E2